MKIGIIGCGHMGSAITKSLISSKVGHVMVASPSRPEFKVEWSNNNFSLAQKCDVIILAVKPGVIEKVLHEITPSLVKNKVIISVAAGITIKKLTSWSSGHKKIIRAMPNLPAQIGFGATVWMPTKAITTADKKLARTIFESFGNEFEVKKEGQINTATAVSGGSPAYVAAFLESMSAVLRKSGFPSDEADAIALSSVQGSSLFIGKNSIDFGELKKAAQTKGGTTEAAFAILKKKGWQKIFEQALQKGTKRAEEIGEN